MSAAGLQIIDYLIGEKSGEGAAQTTPRVEAAFSQGDDVHTAFPEGSDLTIGSAGSLPATPATADIIG